MHPIFKNIICIYLIYPLTIYYSAYSIYFYIYYHMLCLSAYCMHVVISFIYINNVNITNYILLNYRPIILTYHMVYIQSKSISYLSSVGNPFLNKEFDETGTFLMT